MHSLTDSLELIAGLSLAALSALGYGMLAARLTRSESNLPGYGAIGMAVLSSLFMCVHFFVPLQRTVNLCTLAPGVILFGFFFRRVRLVEFAILGVAIWWAVQLNRSADLVPYDHALYHLQSALWNTLEAAIPGIANLHTRLGFNSSVLVLAAGLKIPAFGDWSLAFLSTSLAEGMIVGDMLISIRSAKGEVSRIYCLIAVGILLAEPRWLLVSTYISPDPLAALGVLYLVLLCLEARIPALLLYVPYLVTVKLSVAPVLLLLDRGWPLKKYKVAAGIGVLFLGVWVARNVVLSGHLVFPVAATKLPLSWAERNERTQDTSDWIRSWAKDPGKSLEQTSGLKWIPAWVNRNYADPRLRSAAELACAGIFLLAWKRTVRGLDWRLLGVIALALLFWFFSAPELRFGVGFLFAGGFLLFAYGIECAGFVRLEDTNAWALIALLAIGFARIASVQHVSDWPRTETPPLRLAITPTGDRIWAPTLTDQCWAVIPCSPEPQTIQYYPPRALSHAPPR